MAGDFNADPTCSRMGYAQSNAERIKQVDDAFRKFVLETRGTIVSQSTGSWREARSGKMAKLDHLVLWNLDEPEVGEGRADWVGHQLHDHARVQFCVAKELLLRVDSVGEEWVADVTGKVRLGEINVGEVSSQLLLQRDDIMTVLKKSNTPERRRHEGRRPHRSKAQIRAMRELACAEAALREGVRGERGLQAQELCLAETQIGGELGLTQEEQAFILGSLEWQRFLQARTTC
jgi:hypothetical protein